MDLKKLGRLCPGLAALWVCALAHAGVSYTVTQRDLAAARPRQATATPYYAQDHAIRVGGLRAQRVIVFKDGAIYSIDHRARSLHVLKQARRAQPPAALHLRATDRSARVGSETCRVWEENAAGARHLEVCVVPIGQLSGGGELFDALGELCQYYGGALAALGVGFGPADPWPAFRALKSIPLRVRVFEHGRAVSETELTDIHAAAVTSALFEVPRDYKRDERILH